jgi:prolyl oligopeptidase
LADVVQWVKFSAPVWNADGTGFWYSRYDAPESGKSLTGVNKFQKLYFHTVGVHAAVDDVVVQAPTEPDWGFGASLSEDGRYLVVTVWRGAEPKNQLWVRDLQQADSTFVRLISDFSAQYQFLGNVGSRLYLKTDAGAEKSRIIAVDAADPAAKPVTIVPETSATLTSALMTADALVLHYLQDASSRLVLHDLAGAKRKDVPLPIASVQALSGHQGSAEVFVQLSSFLIPGQILGLSTASGKFKVLFEAKVAADLKRYNVQQTWATSKDGTKVPAFVVRNKKAKPGQYQPTYLYAYGGFNANLTPSFSPAVLAWLELGGTYAVANLRGGGEFGRAWHEAGMREKKQNVFDDFYAVAAHLVSQKWTQPSMLGVGGGSNGGLLIGAALAQRPDLFGAALPAVGVMDMLRFHKFTIGWAWVPEYGSADDAAAFAWLRAYSPVHNLARRCYPPTMVLTGDHDDRVVPAHSFKFTAALQAAQTGTAPVLLRLDRKAGHGAGKPTTKQVDEQVDRWDFLLRTLKPGPIKGTISCQSTP